MTQPPAITRILMALKLQPMTVATISKVLCLHDNTVRRALTSLASQRAVTVCGFGTPIGKGGHLPVLWKRLNNSIESRGPSSLDALRHSRK